MFKRTGINPASVYGALLYASYKLQVPVIPTHDAVETGLVLWSLAKCLQNNQLFAL